LGVLRRRDWAVCVVSTLADLVIGTYIREGREGREEQASVAVWFRDRAGRERTERFAGGTPKRPPEAALDRKAAIERELRHGTYVEREEREVTFADYYARWLAARQISASRARTDAIRARLHVLPY